ncbi:3'-5' exonuclease [Desulfolucanica intricata]|uniref:3'-5' exonuclease n=1 Tax=Desulfolucanica intricata TaxID=1285191 RepID=UPI000833D923|nr:3'-5' exonuclease [Desulfolucanica intricata]
MNYIIYDLELNCSHKKGDIPEIIEIGAVKINENLKIVDTFGFFVKPKLCKKISPFIRKKTKIRQKDIDSAKYFVIVLKKFQRWIGKNYVLCSWGRDDKTHLKRNCEIYKLPTKWLDKHVDIQKQYTLLFQRPQHNQIGLKDALDMLNIRITERPHRALIDAKYTAKIFIKIFDNLNFE